MVVLIFEGVDNLGKSTIINKFVNLYKDTRDITMMHATGPDPNSRLNPALYQSLSFLQKADKLVELAKIESGSIYTQKNLVLLDRAWAGEYVYGQIYRQGLPENISNVINTCENILATESNIQVVTVHLEASPEFVIAHDDNKSFTSNYDVDKRKETVIREIELFNECFKVNPPKHYMKINVEGDNLNYKNADIIYAEIVNNLLTMGIII